MKWYLYIALKQLFPSGRAMSFFAIVSILGVALGVLALFGTQSVMNGFHERIGIKLRDTTGDIIIRDSGRPMYGTKSLVSYLESKKEVKTVELVAQGPVMMLVENRPIFPMLRSYDTIKGKCAIPIAEKKFIRGGSIDDLDDESIIIGQYMARDNAISIGDEVEIVSPTMLDRLQEAEVLMPVRLRVVGVLNTDYAKIDSNVALVSLRKMRELYNLGKGSHSIILSLKDGVDCTEFAKDVSKEVSGFRVSTWLTSNEDFLRIINMEKVMMSIIIVLIIIVASFSICMSLYTSVLRKTREIGLMGAMGARPYQVAAMYCFQGLFIGIFGTLAGFGLTFLIMHFREPIVELIVGREALIKFYQFASLPVKYELVDALRVSAFSICLCTLAGFLPAIRAARLKASEAMRNE